MSIFMDKRSPAYAAAVEALLKLPLDHRSRAFADAAAPEMKRNADRRGRRIATGTRSWRRLFGRRGRYDDALPGDDHAELRLGADPVYVSHPYHLDLDTLRAIVATCDAQGLTCLIHPWSSYFPSRTLSVEWRPRHEAARIDHRVDARALGGREAGHGRQGGRGAVPG